VSGRSDAAGCERRHRGALTHPRHPSRFRVCVGVARRGTNAIAPRSPPRAVSCFMFDARHRRRSRDSTDIAIVASSIRYSAPGHPDGHGKDLFSTEKWALPMPSHAYTFSLTPSRSVPPYVRRPRGVAHGARGVELEQAQPPTRRRREDRGTGSGVAAAAADGGAERRARRPPDRAAPTAGCARSHCGPPQGRHQSKVLAMSLPHVLVPRCLRQIVPYNVSSLVSCVQWQPMASFVSCVTWHPMTWRALLVLGEFVRVHRYARSKQSGSALKGTSEWALPPAAARHHARHRAERQRRRRRRHPRPDGERPTDCAARRGGGGDGGWGLLSSTLQLSLSAFCVTGGAVRGCFGGGRR